MISELRMRLFSPGKNFIDVGNRKVGVAGARITPVKRATGVSQAGC